MASAIFSIGGTPVPFTTSNVTKGAKPPKPGTVTMGGGPGRPSWAPPFGVPVGKPPFTGGQQHAPPASWAGQTQPPASQPLGANPPHWNPVAQPPAAPPAGSGPAAPGSGSQSPDYSQMAADDPTYINNVATNLFHVNQSIGGLQQQLGFDTTDLQSALGQIAYQQPRAQLALEQKANQAGSLYSSVYGQDQGNLTQGYADRTAGLNRNYTKASDTIASRIAALKAGIPIYNAGQLAQATGRYEANLPLGPGSPIPHTGGGTGHHGPTTGQGGGKPAAPFGSPLSGAAAKPITANVIQAIAKALGKNAPTLKGSGKGAGVPRHGAPVFGKR